MIRCSSIKNTPRGSYLVLVSSYGSLVREWVQRTLSKGDPCSKLVSAKVLKSVPEGKSTL